MFQAVRELTRSKQKTNTVKDKNVNTVAQPEQAAESVANHFLSHIHNQA